MKDAVNDTNVLDKLNSNLEKIAQKTNLISQKLQLEFEKSKSYLDGEQFNTVAECVKNATESKEIICGEIQEAKKYIADLKTVILKYSKLQY